MANTEIYYFTGTGNSLVVAKSLADRLDGKLVPITPLLKKDSLETEAEPSDCFSAMV